MLLAFLITTLIIFSINSLAAIYLLSTKINEQKVRVSDIILVILPVLIISWNIYLLINY
jgi:hypothetical protein